ncbi:MAG: glycosyltransferase family 4 protein [Gemmatimonadota bacterium]
MLPPAVVLDWPIGVGSGWGVFGLNLALELIRDGRVTPLFLCPAPCETLHPLHRTALAVPLRQQPELHAMVETAGSDGVTSDFPVLRALGNGLRGNEDGWRLSAPRNVGLIFSEDTAIDQAARARAARFDVIVAGSRWNAEILRAAGIPQVRAIPQGIDPSLFGPDERSGVLGDRFVVFSGGKLEYRKGQDLVIAAFRIFHARHPEAILVTAWHNPWPDTMAGIETTGFVRGRPSLTRAGRLEIVPWLVENGLPEEAVVDLGPLPNYAMAQTLREADVAVFPNRCEGGTNLVAMEAMACGIPTILAANSGHLDLLEREGAALPLTRQGALRGRCPFYRGCEGWGESDVEELVEQMEAVWRDRDAARRVGQAGAAFMREQWTWRQRVGELLEVVAA